MVELVQELVNSELVKLGTQDGELKFSAVTKAEADKVSKMTDEERMIYSHIEAAGRDGIWQKIIKTKTNLHQHIFTKSLKALENKRFVKSIKDVKHPTRKIYMLYNLQPSIALTGGPWFTDSELDTEFVESLLNIVWQFITTKSLPNPFPGQLKRAPGEEYNPDQTTYCSTFDGYPLLEDVLDFILKSGITTVDLSVGDIKSLCDVLEYEDRIERVGELDDCYKATWQSILEKGGGLREGTDPMEIKDSQWSIFDWYTQMPPSENDPDVMCLDSWINS